MNGNKAGNKSLMSRREKLNKMFNPDQEKELDPELEDLYIDDNDKDHYLNYESAKKSNRPLHNEEVENKLLKYKPKTVSFGELKRREEERDANPENYEEPAEESNKQNVEDEDKAIVAETINEMEKDDEEYLQRILKVKPDEIKKGKCVADQKRVYDSLIGLRIYMQNILKDVNRFPQSEEVLKRVEEDENTSHLLEMVQSNSNKLFTNLVKFNQDMLQKGSFKNIIQKSVKADFSILDQISSDENLHFEELERSMSQFQDISEKVVNIWYRKTLVYNNKSNNKLLKVLNANDFCEHIKKSINDNFDTIRLKTKRKRDKYRVVGNPLSTLAQEEDDLIFDDSDFYEYLLKEFFSNQELEDSQNTTNRYDLTLQYLLNRKNKLKSNKKVDQKASKNRKLRYDVHEKIVNFMTPEPNLNDDGRDEMIKSIFGGHRGKSNEERDEEVIDVSII